MSYPAKKIAFFLPSLEMGGAERVTCSIASGLSEIGYQVLLIVAQVQKESSLTEIVGKRVAIKYLSCDGVISSIPKLVKLLKKCSPDILFSAMDHANIAAIVASKLSGKNVKIIPCVHTNVSSNHRGIRGGVVKFLIKLLYPKVEVLVAVSNGVLSDLAKVVNLSRINPTVIYNPIVDDFLYSKAKEKVNHEWFNCDTPIIVSVGRLSAAKNFPLLIDAVSRAQKLRPMRLAIIGEGEERETLEALIDELNARSYICLVGMKTNPAKYMRAANLYVSTSNWEGLPSALIEALALGCTIVATNCPSGPSEVLEDGKWGQLVPVGDVDKLVSAIHYGLDNKLTIPRNAVSRFTKDTIISQYVGLIER